jgi:hypothetical protein
MDDPAYGISVAERASGFEVMLSAEDYHADMVERYGWIKDA